MKAKVSLPECNKCECSLLLLLLLLLLLCQKKRKTCFSVSYFRRLSSLLMNSFIRGGILCVGVTRLMHVISIIVIIIRPRLQTIYIAMIQCTLENFETHRIKLLSLIQNAMAVLVSVRSVSQSPAFAFDSKCVSRAILENVTCFLHFKCFCCCFSGGFFCLCVCVCVNESGASLVSQ